MAAPLTHVTPAQPAAPAATAAGLTDGLTPKGLQDWFKDRGYSMRRLEGLTGRSYSSISQYFNGVYSGDCSAIGDALVRAKRLIEEKATEPEAWQDERFVETSISKEIFTVLRVARLDRDLAVLYGDPGIGKTRSVTEFADQYPGVLYYECNTLTNITTIMRWLCDALHCSITVNPGHLDNAFEAICEALGTHGDRLIVIDQAEFLKIKAMDALRSVHDRTHVPIVLMGLPSLFNALQKKHLESAYILRRVGIRRQLDTPSAEDVETYVRAQGIDDGKAVALCVQNRAAIGRLGTVSKALVKAQRISRVNRVPINHDVMQAAFAQVFTQAAR